MRSLRALMESFLALLCLSSCTSVHSQSEFRYHDHLSPNDGIVLLSNRESEQDFNDDDVDKCIRPAMLDANPDFHFVMAKRFRENLYPYFTPGTTPKDVEGYKRVLDKPEVQQRISSLGDRYLIIMTKGGTLSDRHGGIFCGAGYGGGGCIGLSWWERKSVLDLAVWDLRKKSHAGNVEAKATGTGVIPAFGLPIPVYMPATKSAVCKEIGTRLAKLLSGQE